MALDGAFLYTIKNELKILIDSRVDKIYQPSKDQIIMNLRNRNGVFKLLISVEANSARIHITESSIDNPASPPMFCMLMRKYFSGGKLIGIRQIGLERILFLDFECINDLGDLTVNTIACEIMGKHSNLILINSENKVIDSIKRIDASISSERLILPGIEYELPPRKKRYSFIEDDFDIIAEQILNIKGMDLSKAMIQVLDGVSPLLAREWVFYTGKGADVKISELNEEYLSRLKFILKMTKENVLECKCNFTILTDKEGILKDFSFININQYSNLLISKKMSSACETLDYFYFERDNSLRLKQRANDLFKLLINTSERINKRIVNQKEELELCKNKEQFKLYGDLLSANIYRLKKGDISITVENFYEDGVLLDIKIDKKLTPSQNIQKYYNDYKKASNAENKLMEQIEKGKEEYNYIDSVFDALTRAKTENEIYELKIELAEQGYLKLNKIKGKLPKEQPPLKFVSTDGDMIFVGRNNKQNDKLTTKIAKKTDIWLHTQGINGAHVIIISEPNKSISNKTIEEAAVIAAYHSKAKDSSQVPVDYVEVKYVKKPNGSKPGMVIFKNNTTAYVNPNSDLVERLRER